MSRNPWDVSSSNVSEDEIEAALLLAEYCFETEPPPKSSAQPEEEDAVLKYLNIIKDQNGIDKKLCSGRGRGRGILNHNMAPKCSADQDSEKQLESDIRAASGLGFGNHVIEEFIKERSYAPKKDSELIDFPESSSDASTQRSDKST